MFRILIIDDEEHIRDTLVKMLARHCPQVHVIGTAEGVNSGIKAIRLLNPDIVLLDIQMPDGTGFDLMAACPPVDFKVIFITAYDQFAIQAFRFSAVDYLLKPVNPELLAEAVARAGQMIQEHFNMQIQVLEENLKSIRSQQKKIIIKTTENIHLLDIKNIVSCESDSSYTRIHTAEGDMIMVSKPLKEYDDLLAGCGFYRVHKSHLINLVHIKRFERQDGGNIVLTNDLKVPVASRKRDEILELLERMAD